MPGGQTYLGDFVVVENGGEVTSNSIGDKALKSTCADADTIEVSSTTGQLQIKDAGTSKANGVSRDKMGKTSGFWIRGALVASDAAGGVFSSENSFGTDLICDKVLIAVTTQSSGACELDIGVAADATTADNDLIDGLDVSAAGVFDNITDKGTSGKSRQRFPNGTFINGSVIGGGASSGLVGSYAIHCIDILS